MENSKLGHWKKLGLIFKPGAYPWMSSHAQNPMPELLVEGVYRVHFACRDPQNRARGGYFDFNVEKYSQILGVSEKPSLDLGPLGAFDDSGVMPSSLVVKGSAKYLYYTGWSKAVDVPFSFHIGLAISNAPGEDFKRASLAPVLGRNHFDPFITGAPCVLLENGKFRMWYIAGTQWIRESPEEKPKHYYTIKYAESSDGMHWECSPHICIQYGEGEYAIARPVVWKTALGYNMWFSYRGGNDTYRAGVATSVDGIHWVREAFPLGIATSESGWDSEMVCYAHPLFHKGKTYALYNGNSYGATGIGLAVME